MKALKDALKEDKIYKKHMSRILRMEIKDEVWLDELESLHARRDIRALNTTGLLSSSQRIALDNNIDNQAVRSRCVELKMRAMKQEITYTRSLKLLKRYIPARFATALKEYRTVTERKAVLEYLLGSISEAIDRLKFVTEIANQIIEDCDSAGHTLFRINQLLEQKRKER